MKNGKVVKESGQIHGAIRGLTQIGGWFYFRPKQVKGMRPARVALGTRVFDEAVAKALEHQRETQVSYRPGALQFEASRFMEARKPPVVSQWSWDADESVLKLLGDFMGPLAMVHGITKARMDEWSAYLLKEGKRLPGGKRGPLAPRSVQTYLTRVGTFFQWLVDDGGLRVNPVREMELPKVKKTRVERFCTKDERQRLILRAWLWATPRSQAHTIWTAPEFEVVTVPRVRDDVLLVVLLGFHAGMRLNEIVQARPDWLRFWPGINHEWHGEIVVHDTPTFRPKDREARSIPMNSVLVRFLRPIAERCVNEPFLVRPDVKQGKDKYRWNPRRPFGELLALAGSAGSSMLWVGIHTMRHTYATHLVMGGVPIKTVAMWLGDDEITTAKNYAGYLLNRSHVEAGV